MSLITKTFYLPTFPCQGPGYNYSCKDGVKCDTWIRFNIQRFHTEHQSWADLGATNWRITLAETSLPFRASEGESWWQIQPISLALLETLYAPLVCEPFTCSLSWVYHFAFKLWYNFSAAFDHAGVHALALKAPCNFLQCRQCHSRLLINKVYTNWSICLTNCLCFISWLRNYTSHDYPGSCCADHSSSNSGT
jgi:hypothetical protein